MSRIEQLPFAKKVYAAKGQRTSKTIIIFHGWGSSINNYEEFALSLSHQGFQVVVPEIAYHDSRSKLANHFNRLSTQEYFWKAIFSSIDEAEDLITELGVFKKDIILLGVSMGGFIANGIHANIQDFGGLININGSGSFLLSERIFRENDNRPPLLLEEIQKLNSYDPVLKDKSFSPVLLMHGEQDTVVSINGQKDYYAYLADESESTNITFLKYENINHTISEKMSADLIQWLENNFKD